VIAIHQRYTDERTDRQTDRRLTIVIPRDATQSAVKTFKATRTGSSSGRSYVM